MPRILIAYTTNSGSTEEVAQAIAEVFTSCGAVVDVRRAEEVSSLSEYTAVVVGGPMILGWSRAARRFVRQHRQALQQVPVAYFFTALSLTRLPGDDRLAFPIFVDPELGAAPKNAARLSFKENYATLANYIKPALQSAPQITPASAAFFGGKLELFRLKWWQAIFVMLIIGAQPGDRRNWPAIRQWAAELAPRLNPETSTALEQASASAA